MKTSRLVAALAAAATGTLVLTMAPTTAVAAGIPRVDQVGTLRIDGCVVKQSDIALTATPAWIKNFNDKDPDDAIGSPYDGPLTPAGRVRNASVKGTADPHVFTFVVRQIKADRPYTFDIRLKKSCGPMTWIGPTRGVFAPGQAGITLRGIAITTKLEVGGVDANGVTTYRASDFYTDASPQKRFRWSTALGGTDALLQLSLTRFPEETETATTCATPPGLFLAARLHGVAGTNVTPPIDIDQLVNLVPKVEGTGGGVLGDGSGGFGTGSTGPVPGAGGAPEASFTSFDTFTPLTSAQRMSVHLGTPVFARLIPLSAAGALACNVASQGAPSFAALVRQVGISVLDTPGQSLLLSGSYQQATPVDPHDICVTVVKDHPATTSLLPDFWAYVITAHGGATNGVIGEGTMYCANQSTSVFDAIGNFVSGFVDAIVQIVDYVADLYNGIKAKIVDIAAAAIDFVGIIDCNEYCREALNAALTAALVALGLPPSLPNVDELMNDGEDYLAEQISEQTGNVPGVKQASKALIHEIVKRIKDSQGGGGGLPDWLVEDNGFRPAVMSMTLQRTPNPEKGPADGFKVSGDGSPRWQDAIVPLPAGLDTIQIPVVLRPDISGAPRLTGPFVWPESLQLKLALQDWYNNRFAGRCTIWRFGSLHGNVSVLDGFASLEPLTDAGIADLGSWPIDDTLTCA